MWSIAFYIYCANIIMLESDKAKCPEGQGIRQILHSEDPPPLEHANSVNKVQIRWSCITARCNG